MCAQGVVIHCTGSDSIRVTTQLKTSENCWEHRKTPKIIWYHPENNWGPLKDNLVQFEEDFNSGTKKSVGWGGPDGYLRPVQFLDHLTVIIIRLPTSPNKVFNTWIAWLDTFHLSQLFMLLKNLHYWPHGIFWSNCDFLPLNWQGFVLVFV